MKIIEIIIQSFSIVKFDKMGRGRRIAISTSKTKKIIAIMKNRKEKGIREAEKGAKPHS